MSKQIKISLLDQAKQITTGHKAVNISAEDHIQLSIAFLAKEITLTQLATVVWPDKEPREVTSRVYVFVTQGLKKAYEAGKITRAN